MKNSNTIDKSCLLPVTID